MIWKRVYEGGQWRNIEPDRCVNHWIEWNIKENTGQYRRAACGHQEYVSWQEHAFDDIEKALEAIHRYNHCREDFKITDMLLEMLETENLQRRTVLRSIRSIVVEVSFASLVH